MQLQLDLLISNAVLAILATQPALFIMFPVRMVYQTLSLVTGVVLAPEHLSFEIFLKRENYIHPLKVNQCTRYFKGYFVANDWYYG